jgi:plasmid stabilization system protein ParE
VRFTVVWKQSALDELAEIWLRVADRESISITAASVDRILADDPRTKGDEFYGDLLLIVDHLEVTYSVSDEDQMVRVLQVFHY